MSEQSDARRRPVHTVLPDERRQSPAVTPPHAELEADGAYRVDRYDAAPGFCSFLPGLAGPDGVPLWCMYVNRAQGVVSFGVQDKDHAIAEFLPAPWAYQLVGIQGFRTFCKIDGAYYEPFRDGTADSPECARHMRIYADLLEVGEANPGRGLSWRVQYFAPPNHAVGALIRRVTIRNISAVARRITVLDGLPLLVPAGFTDGGLKITRHISQAYASVRIIGGHVPLYTAKVAAHDEAEVIPLTGGNFYAAWIARSREWRPVRPLVDPHIVFGGDHDLVTPRLFVEHESLDPAAQVWENRLPCALVPLDAVLEPEGTIELVAIAGYAAEEHLIGEFVTQFRRRAAVDEARARSRAVLEDVVRPAWSASAQPTLDAYVRHNYLDNVLRGGVPRLLPSKDGPTLLHLYVRRHGDLERDYNYFILPAHPLSSGAGNYRDICQNRRWDVWFYPQVGAAEIKLFVSLIQADGYNPLAIEGYRWRLGSTGEAGALCPTTDAAARAAFERIVERDFQPGELLDWANCYGVSLPERGQWLERILARCDRRLVAHGHAGGYWIDHWTYVIELLEAFAAVYPDEVTAMLAGAADVGWFDEGARVVSREEKYVRRPAGLLQIHAVREGAPSSRPLPSVTVLGKLCALVAVKAVSFDYGGVGIEMEAGRPGWNDSLNGLPGLFGSSTCEAAELARLAAWLRARLPQMPDVSLPEEVAEFVEQVVADLEAAEYCWDRAATLREAYRTRVQAGASGRVRTVPGALVARLLAGAERRGDAALARGVDPRSGLLHTYYRNRPAVTTDGPVRDETAGVVRAAQPFVAEPLPLYLEGQVHWLRRPSGQVHARAIYQAVRRSALFDSVLKMYKLNECLADCPPEIGRARTFTRGWFENESIWLHMSYKYLLELLRAGLYEEFFADARTMLVPFMNAEVYGRSVLENSSFLASSANPDPRTHGRGFIARMSGSTAEFIDIWLRLTVGAEPFRMEGSELHFQLRPVLPAEWFTQQATRVDHVASHGDIPANSLACTLLGSVLLVYHNETRRDTFGLHGVQPTRYVIDGRDTVDGAALVGAAARRIRQRGCARLDVWLS